MATTWQAGTAGSILCRIDANQFLVSMGDDSMSIIRLASKLRRAKNDDEALPCYDKLGDLYRAAKTLLAAEKKGQVHDFMLLDLESALGAIDDEHDDA